MITSLGMNTDSKRKYHNTLLIVFLLQVTAVRATARFQSKQPRTKVLFENLNFPELQYSTNMTSIKSGIYVTNMDQTRIIGRKAKEVNSKVNEESHQHKKSIKNHANNESSLKETSNYTEGVDKRESEKGEKEKAVTKRTKKIKYSNKDTQTDFSTELKVVEKLPSTQNLKKWHNEPNLSEPRKDVDKTKRFQSVQNIDLEQDDLVAAKFNDKDHKDCDIDNTDNNENDKARMTYTMFTVVKTEFKEDSGIRREEICESHILPLARFEDSDYSSDDENINGLYRASANVTRSLSDLINYSVTQGVTGDEGTRRCFSYKEESSLKTFV